MKGEFLLYFLRVNEFLEFLEVKLNFTPLRWSPDVMLVFGFNTLGYLVYTNKRRDAPSRFEWDKVGRLSPRL